MEGWRLLQKMRMHPTTAGIPIVACTAAVKQVRETEAYLLQQGIEVVLKPFTIDQLEGAVNRALARHRFGRSMGIGSGEWQTCANGRARAGRWRGSGLGDPRRGRAEVPSGRPAESP